MNGTQHPVFVVVEGLDGVGKTTVVRELARRLDAVVLHTPPAEMAELRPAVLRCFADSMLATTLFYGATLATASQRIMAYRAAGRSVVLDRYYLSTCAYGEVMREAVHPQQLLDLLAAQLLPADATVYLHANIEQRRMRMASRGLVGDEDRRSISSDLSERLDAAFRRRAGHPLAGRWLEVDTSARTAEAAVTESLRQLAEVGFWRPCLTVGGISELVTASLVQQGGAP
jgi:dTMP kinase